MKSKLSNSDQSYISLAYRIAEANTEYPNHRFGSVLVRSGSVLAVGWNRFRNDPHLVELPKEEASVHAEADVIKRAPNPAGSVLYVARITPGGASGLSRPCINCAQTIGDAGIKRVVYSQDYDGRKAESIKTAHLLEMHGLTDRAW